MLSRRKFLARSSAVAVVALEPRSLVAALEQAASPPPRIGGWEDVRKQFALAPGWLHFASFFLVSHPAPVRAAIDDFRRALDANPVATVHDGMFGAHESNLQWKVAEDAAAYMGCRPEEIAITGNTTTSLALVYHGLPLRSGDEILTTAHDHFSHHESIRLATERAGATWRKVSLFDRSEDASAATIVQRVRSAVGPRTRAVGVTWVHSSSGVRLPIRAIADALAEINRTRPEAERVLLIVDGVHGFGAVDESVPELGCDYFCSGTHKWIFAPRGTGIIWATARSWSRLRPTIPTFSGREAIDAWKRETPFAGPITAAVMTPGGFAAFEHQWAMGAAFRFHRQLGRAKVAQRIRELNDRCKAGLAKIPGVTLRTPRDPALSAGIICFEVDGLSPQGVVDALLARKIVASTSPYRVSYARLAPSLVNTPEEVDRAVDAVRGLARA